MIFKSEEEARECLAHWQKILRLQDWKMDITLVRQVDMRNDHEAGTITIELGNKKAWIKLRRADDWPSDRPFDCDHQLSIVHELLHLFENAITNRLPEKWKDRVYYDSEQLCECLAEAFVSLHSWTPESKGIYHETAIASPLPARNGKVKETV